MRQKQFHRFSRFCSFFICCALSYRHAILLVTMPIWWVEMRKILIATGSEIINECFAQRLRNEYNVQLCLESDLIISTLERTHPEVLIINLRLPHITGLDILRQSAYKPQTVIALTPILSSTIVDEAQAAGVGALIRLPCSIDCVISHLNNLLPLP